jgi:ABC-type polysaccharide/polyol phosphate transport system ATPase subunit
MITKKTQCPKCRYIISSSGNPGEVVKITCPSCGNIGKISFKKEISDNGKVIEVFNLKKAYGDLIAVNDISFSINKGEIFAFLGPNGAGKTTTVEMIESIRQPTSGEIKFWEKILKLL